MKPLIVLLITGTLAAAAVTAQVPADSAKVYFRLGHRQYDPAFRNNSAGITPFVKEVKRHNAASNIERITVRSYTSPDGSNAANERLSRNRCSSISELILNETGIDPSLMHTEAEGIAWDELLRMVEADTSVPYRDEVTELLRNTPLWVFDENNRVVGGRKKSLMELRGGVPYRWLYTNIFPALRNAVAVSLFVKQPDATAEPAAAAPEKTRKPIASGIPRISRISRTSGISRNPSNSGASSNSRTPPRRSKRSPASHTPWHRLAIKTNLLYDAILMPSLEVEYRFNDRWTVNAEGDVAWWHNDPKHKYYQVMILSGEGRYWFKHYNNRPWHGFYVGAFGGGGKYDLENGNRGYKGTGYMAGISAWFMFPVNRNISFEAGLGVGYLTTKYEEYLPFEGHYVYQQTSRTGYFGPLKLKFALVWRLWDINKNKKGGAANL